MSMPMKTRFRATFLPLVALGALAFLGACSDVTAPQPSSARAPQARSNFGGFFGAESTPLDSLEALVSEPVPVTTTIQTLTRP